MHIREILLDRRKALLGMISAAQSELEQVDRALEAIGTDTALKSEVSIGDKAHATIVRSETSAIRHSMPVNDAVVLAVEAGRKTPTAILDYLREELGINTTINSVRSRVSPLKKAGRIDHDGTGWIPAQKKD